MSFKNYDGANNWFIFLLQIKFSVRFLAGVDTVIGISDITDNSNIWRSLVGEFIGTLMLVLVGCGSVVAIGSSPSFVQIALTFGLVVATMAQVRLKKKNN